MNLTIFGLALGTLPGWVPVWAVPAAIIHIALFLALIVPAWVALARARSGGPLALVLVLPVLGLLMLTPVFMNRVLPYAHWGRFWGILVLIPGLNIFFLWIFAFAPWKRRYIPLDHEEFSEPVTGMGPRKGAPKLATPSGEPASQAAGAQTMMQGAPATPYGGDPGAQTMFPGAGAAPLSPRSGEPANPTIMAGPAGSVSRTPPAPARTGTPAEGPQATILAGNIGQQPLAEPIQPNPPIPARSQREPQSSTPTAPPPVPLAAAPPPERVSASPAEPPRPRAPERTQDLTVRNQPPPEAATVRVAQAPRAGGRAWRLVGSNDVAKSVEFTVQEAALLESEAGLLIGRSARAHFVIDHDSISRNHARFLIDRGTLLLEDLDSMNGTWVDGKKLEANEPVPLAPNGIVEIGKLALRVTGG